MTRNEFDNKLLDYTADRLSSSDKAAFLEVLRDDESLQAELLSERKIEQFFRAQRQVDHGIDPDFDKLMQRIEKKPWWLTAWQQPAAAMAAALALVAFLSFQLFQSGVHEPVYETLGQPEAGVHQSFLRVVTHEIDAVAADHQLQVIKRYDVAYSMDAIATGQDLEQVQLKLQNDNRVIRVLLVINE